MGTIGGTLPCCILACCISGSVVHTYLFQNPTVLNFLTVLSMYFRTYSFETKYNASFRKCHQRVSEVEVKSKAAKSSAEITYSVCYLSTLHKSRVCGNLLVEHLIAKSRSLIRSWSSICCYNSLHSSGKAFH